MIDRLVTYPPQLEPEYFGIESASMPEHLVARNVQTSLDVKG